MTIVPIVMCLILQKLKTNLHVVALCGPEFCSFVAPAYINYTVTRILSVSKMEYYWMSFTEATIEAIASIASISLGFH